MKKFYTIFFALTLLRSLSVQACLPDGIFFSTQSEIDNFQSNYPGCTEIEGNVTIQGDDITNLTGLNNLISIAGNMDIGNEYGGNPYLFSLSGLENLTSIGGRLFISRNFTLTNLSGLDALTEIGTDLHINYNSNLTSLSGIEQVTFIERDLILVENNSLTSLSALHNLTGIGRHLTLYDDWALTYLDGLENIISIGGDLFFSCIPIINFNGLNNLSLIGGNVMIGNFYWGGLPDLTNLSGLESLTSIGGVLGISANNVLTDLSALGNLSSVGSELWISWNRELKTLYGFEGLTSINGALSIGSNDSLIDISGLKNISSGSILNLYIDHNHQLSTCQIHSVCDYLASPHAATVFEENAQGCMTENQVKAACATLGIKEETCNEEFNVIPNPVVENATVIFKLVNRSKVKIDILNQLGKIAINITDAEYNAGIHRENMNTVNLPSGLYYCRIRKGVYESNLKFVVL